MKRWCRYCRVWISSKSWKAHRTSRKHTRVIGARGLLHFGKVGRVCRFGKNPKYKCSGGFQAKRLCQRHYNLRSLAIRKGSFKTLQDIPDAYFSEEAIQSRRLRSVRLAIQARLRSRREGAVNKHCRLFGRGVDFYCEHVIENGLPRTARGLCGRHYRMVPETIRALTSSLPDDFFSESVRSVRRYRRQVTNAQSGRRVRRFLLNKGFRFDSHRKIYVLQKEGCRLRGQPGFTCWWHRGEVFGRSVGYGFCSRHYYAGAHLVKRQLYPSMSEIPDKELSDVAVKARWLVGSIKGGETSRRFYESASL